MRFFRFIIDTDWVLLLSAVALSVAGLVTMNSFGDGSYFASRQAIWLALGVFVFFVTQYIDWRFLRNTRVVVSLFVFSALSLALLFVVGTVAGGAERWFDFGIFSVQPSDPVKLVVILILAKYFARRHVEIANVRHILVSGMYVFLLFVFVFLQPDFSSAMIIFAIWFGMVFVSGISKKHILAVFSIGIVSFALLWMFLFQDYQKARIMNFINPLADIQGTGYNAFQSTIAVGSGQLFGKGIGFGSQSKLKFLPEYQTDFIFAAFAEEWGLVGILIIFILFGLIIWRLLVYASRFHSNFEALFTLGVVILFLAHFTVHVGMNIGLLPVTGLTMPFMSYGGSHLLMEFLALGIVLGMNNYSRKSIEPEEILI